MVKKAIYIVSDSIGETANMVTSAALAQFPSWTDYEVKRFPLVKTKDHLQAVIKEAKTKEALVCATFVDPKMEVLAAQYTEETDLTYVNYMDRILAALSEYTGKKPVGKSGAVHQMDREYFDRITAMEFAVKYDDGKNFQKAMQEAELIILGISRTSKTPLSMFLANKGHKVANLPLVPEVEVPEELFEMKHACIIGLTASPRYIMNVRHQRLKYLGLSGMANYSNMERIHEELLYADRLYKQLEAQVINVENKSIEESAAEIEYLLAEH